MFIDSHAHLEMEQFDADREAMIARARDGGIEKIVAIGSGTGPGSLDCGIQLAEQHEFILATIGIHPHEAKLADGCRLSRARPIGETAQSHCLG